MKRIIEVRDTLRYAHNDIKRYGILSLISLIAMAIFIVILVVGDLTNNSLLMALGILGMPCFVILCLGSFLLYLDVKIYISDLDKKGFLVPENRQDCDYRLSMLYREEIEIQEGAINKRNLVLAIVAGVITLIVIVYNFTLAKRPHPLAIILMLIITAIMFLQSFNRFYKNDIDIDVEDSRKIRQRIVPAAVGVGIWFFVIWMGVQFFNIFPVGNEHYYAQIVRYHKREDAENYRYYMDRLPSYAEDVRFISWGRSCGVSFYVPQENVKDMQAYFESIEEPYVIHTIEEGQTEFTKLCSEVKAYTTYFRSEDYENCMVYEFTEWYVYENGNTESWYAIIDTNSGEVGYGYCPTDW